MRDMKLSHFALLLVALLFASSIAFGVEIVEPATAPVYPLAIVCVESPGTSEDRPCEPWCERRLVSTVFRFMRVEQGDESVSYEWRDADCGGYLAERLAL